MASERRERTWLQRGFERLGRALDPDAARDREQLRAFLRAWREQDEARGHAHQTRLKGLEASVETVSRETAANRRQLLRVRELFSKQRVLLSEVVRRTSIEKRATEVEQRIVNRLARFSRSSLPVVIGPWTGEVGFELLYWIPFLHWVRETFPFETDRLIVVSRGGVRAWYSHVSPHYQDIFEHATPAEFQVATVERKKQQRIGVFDRLSLKRALRARGIRRAHLLHPTLMYSLFNSFWRYSATVKRLESFARFRALPPVDPAIAAEISLPPRFVAVRFYFSECFPETAENRRFAAQVIEGLTARHHVVLLNNDLVVDDHRDFTPEQRSRVHVLSAGMRPETNLAVQTAAISRATAFVGTYGGYSYLAPLYGVSSVALYSRKAFKQHHLELAHRAFQRIGSARLVPVDVRKADLLADLLAGVSTSPELSST
jgi:hypothetical protein